MPVIDDLKAHGDRTSSFMTAYPGFESFEKIRYVETSSAWFGATEPLTDKSERAAMYVRFDTDARKAGKTSFMGPATQELSSELTELGYRRLQVGSEPIFNLKKYFSDDPLMHLTRARALKLKGATVTEYEAKEISAELKSELDAILKTWLESKKTGAFQFLNQVNLWHLAEHKKLFVLTFNGKINAFLFTVPIYTKNSYFVAELIRTQNARIGASELLLVESMRQLHEQNYHEVRLGLCPMARLEQESWPYPLMRWVFHSRVFFNFRSIYEFKDKFNPTRWEPLYLVTKSKSNLKTMRAVYQIHFPNGISFSISKFIEKKVRPYLQNLSVIRPSPKSFSELVHRTKITLGFSAVVILLHMLRSTVPAVEAFFVSTGFSASNITANGVIFAPLFHNNQFHLLGDVFTLIAFAGALDLMAGRMIALAVIAAGLWLSNPLTAILLDPVLRMFSETQLSLFYSVTDYGSSNAVYAAAGAVAALLKRPAIILLPLSINAVVYAFLATKWLAVHHLFALAFGFFISKIKTR